MKEFDLKKVSDQHESEHFETQLLVKFQPNRTTESKVMPSRSPCISHGRKSFMALAKDKVIFDLVVGTQLSIHRVLRAPTSQSEGS